MKPWRNLLLDSVPGRSDGTLSSLKRQRERERGMLLGANYGYNANKRKRGDYSRTRLSVLLQGCFKGPPSASSLRALDRPPKNPKLTHVDPSDAFVLVNDEHVEAVADFDVSLGRAGKGVRQQFLHLFQLKLGSLALDGRGRGRVGNLVLLVDLAMGR